MSEKNKQKNKQSHSANVTPLRNWPMNNVASIKDFQRDRALENLRRLTGLEFANYPDSLVNPK